MRKEWGQKPNAGRFAGGHGFHFIGCKGETKGFGKEKLRCNHTSAIIEICPRLILSLSRAAAIPSPLWVPNRVCRLCAYFFPPLGAIARPDVSLFLVATETDPAVTVVSAGSGAWL
jgi:hypothetical protein